MYCENFRVLAPFVFLASLVGEPSNAGAQDPEQRDAALKERFLGEAPVQWKDYAEKAKQLQGRFSFEISAPAIRTRVQNASELKKNSKNRLIIASMERTTEEKKDYEDYFL